MKQNFKNKLYKLLKKDTCFLDKVNKEVIGTSLGIIKFNEIKQ